MEFLILRKQFILAVKENQFDSVQELYSIYLGITSYILNIERNISRIIDHKKKGDQKPTSASDSEESLYTRLPFGIEGILRQALDGGRIKIIKKVSYLPIHIASSAAAEGIYPIFRKFIDIVESLYKHAMEVEDLVFKRISHSLFMAMPQRNRWLSY